MNAVWPFILVANLGCRPIDMVWEKCTCRYIVAVPAVVIVDKKPPQGVRV
jgi:hypothetical protein